MRIAASRGRLTILAILGCLVAGSARAQEFRATVTGRVTDPGGLAVPGATVTALNTQTGEVATGFTTADGAYTIPFLKPGIYTVSAELTGFKKVTQPNVQLEVGQSSTINFQLQLGTVSEELTVTGESPVLETSKADRGLVIDNERVTELPLNARNPFMLSYLSPGITYNGPAIYQRPFDNGAIADWSINGGQNRNNEFLLDGAPNNSIQGGNNIAYVPAVDAVQEFKIVTNSYDAQYGRTAGGVVNVQLKSGSNNLHGTVYEFARRKALDSNEYFFKVNNREKPAHKLDQYGIQIDGPVIKNKTFFMNNYVFAPNLAFDTFRNIATKVDQNVSDKTKLFVRYAYNKRTEQRSTNGILSGPAQDGQLPLWRINHTGVGDWVRTVSSSLVVNVRTGVNQYLELARSDPGLSFNPADLGFPSSFVNQLPNKVFPRLNHVT